MAISTDELKVVITAQDKASLVVDSVLGRIRKSILNVGAAYLSWRALESAVTDIVRVGSEAEKVWAGVEASLRRHNIAVMEGKKAIDELSLSLMKQTGIEDETIARGIQELIDNYFTLGDAMRSASSVMDFAAGKNIDVASAFFMLSKSINGSVNMMSRYGIEIDKTLSRQGQLQQFIDQVSSSYGGAASAAADTAAGKMKIFAAEVENVKERLYELAAPALQGVFTGLSLQIEKVQNKLNAVNVSVQDLSTSFQLAAEVLGRIASVLWNTVEEIYRFFDTAISGIVNLTKTALITADAFFSMWNGDKWKKVGTSVDATINSLDAHLIALGQTTVNLGKSIYELGFDYDEFFLKWFTGLGSVAAATGSLTEEQQRLMSTLDQLIAANKDKAIEAHEKALKASEETAKKYAERIAEATQALKEMYAVTRQATDTQAALDRALGKKQTNPADEFAAGPADANDLVTESLRRVTDAYRDLSLEANTTYAMIEDSTQYLCDKIFNNFKLEQIKLKDIWKLIAEDFKRMVISQITASLYKSTIGKAVTGLLGAVGLGGFGKLNPLYVGGGSTSSVTVNLTQHISGNVTTEEFVRNTIVPATETAVKRSLSNLSLTSPVRMGNRYAVTN